MRKRHRDIVRRWSDNPILSTERLPFACSSICNAGAAKLGSEYLLLLTIQTLEGVYVVVPARSADGYHFDVSERPLMTPSQKGPWAPYEEMGVMDARVVSLGRDHYICYDAFGPHGYRMGLARTDDFVEVERVGLVSQVDSKGGALFPRKIRGKYARLERPWEGCSIWVSYSNDLEYWGWSEVVMTPRGGFWDCSRIGVAAPPIEIDEGWLELYYGVKDTSAGPLFRLGAAILDAENPARVLGRTNVPILSPREPYERVGDVPNLVFSRGAILEPDGEVKIYYGASNACICMGLTTVGEIVDTCLQSEKEF